VPTFSGIQDRHAMLVKDKRQPSSVGHLSDAKRERRPSASVGSWAIIGSLSIYRQLRSPMGCIVPYNTRSKSEMP